MTYIHYCTALLLVLAAGCSGKETGGENIAVLREPEPAPVPFKSEKLTYRIDTIARDLENPWGMAFLPDGRMLVTERSGVILIFQHDERLDAKIEIPDVFVHGQGGLMDIRLHPDYARNGWVYISYSKKGEGGGGTVIARTKLDGNKITGMEELFAAQPLSESGVNFGSRIAFDGNGYMFFSTGERGTNGDAQNLTNHLGKILRLYDDGRIPDDNPFVDSTDAKPGIWSYGHRNPQGMIFDADTKTLWVVDHGPRGGDELNRIEKGGNFGWPEFTYGVNYDGTPIAAKNENQELEEPVTYWDPAVAPCGMTLVKGNKYNGWQNNLLIAALATKQLIRIELADGQYVGQEKLLDKVARIRSVEESPEGFIYAATEGPGMILKLIPVEAERSK